MQNLGGPRVSYGSLVGGVRVPKTLGPLPTQWWVKPDSRASARLPEDRAGSWRLLQGLGIPELISDYWGIWGHFLTQLGMGSTVSQTLHCPASGQGQVPADSRVWSGLNGWCSQSTGYRIIVFLLLVSAP